MARVIGELLGSVWLVWWVFALFVGVIFAGVLPFMAFKALRAIVGIHRELETVNLNLDEAVRLMRAAAPPDDDRLARRFQSERHTHDAGAARIR